MQPQTQTYQRAQHRMATRIGITCRPFTSIGEWDASDGELLNYCDAGSYIVTSRALAAGSVVVVRLVRFPENESLPMTYSGVRTIFLAEVKWTQSIQEGPACRYGSGLRYLD